MTPAVADAPLADLLARVEQQEERLRRMEATLRALARLPDAPAPQPSPPATLTDTKRAASAVTPPIIPLPARPKPAGRPTVHGLPPDRPEAEADLLRAAVDLAPEATVGVDAAGAVRVWNPAAAKLFGWSAGEVIGSSPPFLPDDRADEHADLLRGGPARDVPTVRRGKDGALIPVRVTVAPGRSGGVVFTFRADETIAPHPPDADPTAGRFVALGRALAGVVHDFNNLLSVIQGHAELLAEKAEPGSPQREAADTIAATTDLAAGVTRHLLAVAKPEPGTPPRTDINLLLGRLDRVLRAVLGARITLAVTPAPGLGLAAVHPAELTQVLLNLATNARDAMPDGGTFTVRTAAQFAGAGRPGWPADGPAGEFVVLTVGDTGAGMDEATRARVFDPFFTTKPTGVGTGIGLTTVRDVVARAGGHIELESEPGWGTQVRVYFRKA